jgi:hypothetical protein
MAWMVRSPCVPHRDPSCVYVANTIGEALVVAGWLREQGIPAEVMHAETLGTLPPTVAVATGIEVWVVDRARASEAIRLLGEHALERFVEKQTGAPLEVVCDECGRISSFPAAQRGSVQSCPHCFAYLDVEPAEEGVGSQELDGSERITTESPGRGTVRCSDTPPVADGRVQRPAE